MANRGAQYKQMPNSVILRYFLIKIEDTSQSVKPAADYNQNKHGIWQGDKKPSPANEQKPTHCDIDYKAKNFFLYKEYFKYDAKQHQRPLDYKKGNAKRVPHIHKQKRSISAGYQKINRDMIPGAEYFFRVTVLHAMVKGAECEHHQKTERVDGCPHNAGYIACTRANRGKNRNARDAKQNAYSVC